MSVKDRLMHVWNAFKSQDVGTALRSYDMGVSYGGRPDNRRYTIGNERSIVSAIYTRMTNDAASIDIRHVRMDEFDRYLEDVDSGLNNCLTLEANIDQAARQFRVDIVATLLDKGIAAIVPVDTTLDPAVSGSYDIKTMRVGDIVSWFPNHVRVSVYNEAKGQREEITLPKRQVAIVENPFYAVMNEPSSTLQRLIRKLNLLDAVDEQTGSGKLDLIIQLPYVIKSEARRQQAQQRRTDIEHQLKDSKYGIAYTDGTEKITQLNRPAENNLLKQIEYLVNMLYGQLGLTPEIMNGTATEEAMLNYMNRTIEPIMTAVVEAMKRSFLTKTARSQKQSIMYFRDPFRLVPIGSIADIADKFTRNEIATSNEIRQIVGWKPHADPKADQLVNSNMPQPSSVPGETPSAEPEASDGVDAVANDAFDSLDTMLDDIYQTLGVDEDAVS